MILEQVKALRHREALIYVPTGKRWFVSGAVKIWKTRPNEVKVPIKHGLYSHDYLTHENMEDFIREEEV